MNKKEEEEEEEEEEKEEETFRITKYFLGHVTGSSDNTNRYSNPNTGLDRTRGFQQDEAPRYQDSRHMNELKLSALHIGRLYLPRNIPGAHFC
jgi:hypothetical protein